MKQISRGRTVTAIVVAATALALAASWLVAGATAPAPTVTPETLPPAAGSAETPLPDFLPSERLPAGSSVAFPTDI